MIKSMTGYGKGSAAAPGGVFLVEIRSVNHRYGEISVRMPRAFMSFENEVKRLISSVLKRGKIEVFVQWEESAAFDYCPQIDLGVARGYRDAFHRLADELQVGREIPLSLIISQKGVIKDVTAPVEETGFQPFIISAVQSAVEAIDLMRKKEGDILAIDLLARRKLVSEWTGQISERVPQVIDEYRLKLKARLGALLEGGVFDDSRMLQEIALLVDRSDITEELVRLSSHFKQFDEALRLAEPVGRKLDFLMQEMNREVNTIGSKSNDTEISAIVIRIKAEMEKMREQVQNVE